MDAATLQLVVDAIFKEVEAVEGNHPLLLAATEFVRKTIDAEIPAILGRINGGDGPPTVK